MSRSTDAGGAASAVDSNDDEEVDEGAEALTDRQILVRAVAGMAGGLGICAAFSDPLVDALSELSQVGQNTITLCFLQSEFPALCCLSVQPCNTARQLPASVRCF